MRSTTPTLMSPGDCTSGRRCVHAQRTTLIRCQKVCVSFCCFTEFFSLSFTGFLSQRQLQQSSGAGPHLQTGNGWKQTRSCLSPSGIKKDFKNMTVRKEAGQFLWHAFNNCTNHHQSYWLTQPFSLDCADFRDITNSELHHNKHPSQYRHWWSKELSWKGLEKVKLM